MAEINAALRTADAIRVDHVHRAAARRVVEETLRTSLPKVDEVGIDALSWRWAFLSFHG